MIKHVVLFKLVAFDDKATKIEKLNEIKSALEGLPPKIKEIISLEVGLNVNSVEAYDIALTVGVDSMEALEIYAKHPDHMACSGIIRPVLESRSCVDFKI